jgi:GT2 family glycosyltransferase
MKGKVRAATAEQLPGEAADAFTADRIAYRSVVHRIHEVTQTLLPDDATIVIVGKAESELLNLRGRNVWRFPQAPDGSYAGYYPACSTAAIVHLEAIRSKGAGFLLIPEISRWWLEHYVDFAQHVRRRYPCLLDEAGVGLYFSLRPQQAGIYEPAPRRASDVWQTIDDVLERVRGRGVAEPAILDCRTGLDLAANLPQQPVFSPASSETTLPYLDHSIDIVAVRAGDATAEREADRVAQSAVLLVRNDGGDGQRAHSVTVRWNSVLDRTAPPTVSIVIPCLNGIAHTDACLTALRETLPDDFAGEIIVVDDGSDAETLARLKTWSEVEPRLRVLRNESNMGFIRSVNKGADAATGEILIFLNNDTIPIAGWLPPLLRTFRERPDAGAVGGRLVYPSGRLQEAGGVVFRDGSAANFGRDDHDPDLPMYRVFREVDYCSAALLATPRATFLELGGFDLHYEPGYYEDTDYCFRLRDRGYRVFLQPESVVMHCEGATAGLDVSVGMKRYQVVNREKFITRWQDALERQADRPDRLDFVELHALTGRYLVNRDGAA